MAVTPAIDVTNAAVQAIIQHLLLDAALFATGMVAQPDVGSGYTGVYPKVVPPPNPGGSFGRDEEYPAIVVSPQGIVPEYTMQGGPNAVGFHGQIQVVVGDMGRETITLAPIFDEIYSWLWQLNELNNTLITSIFPILQLDVPEIDANSNPWSWIGARFYVTGRMSNG